MHTVDASLIQQIKNGDHRAYKHFFQSTYPQCYKKIFRILRDEQLSKDVTQELYIRFWQKRQALDSSFSPTALIFKMATNLAIDNFRRQKKFKIVELQPEVNPIEKSAEENDSISMKQIQQAISQLPPKRQAIFRLSKEEKMSYKDIAVHLNISVKTVENQMSQAFKDLRVKLAPLLDQHSFMLLLIIFLLN